MGILQRVVNMTRAAANEMLDKMENPVMMLNHYLRDLDEEITKAERALVQQQAQERMMISKYEELSSQASYYEKKAATAVAEDRETEARAALEAKLLYLEQAEETAKLRELSKNAAVDLELRVESLKEEKTKLQSKREELVTRVRRASNGADSYSSQASANVLHGSSAARGFERIEQKVMEWEAERELAKSSYGAYGHSTHIAEQKQEQRSALVEEQLQRLLQKKSGS